MPGEWTGTAEAYESSFARLCAGAVRPTLDVVDALVAHPPSPPVTLLDVGTGPGTLARAAAARGYAVTGCDPEPSMVHLAKTRAGGPSYREAGLPTLPYDDAAFDVVCANFVINHTNDPRAAVGELRRVCGTLAAVTVWPRIRTRLNGLWSGIVRDAGANTPPGIVLPPDVDFERSESGLADLLMANGFHDARVIPLEWDFVIRPDELWPAVAAGVATVGTTYVAQDAAGRHRMHDAYLARTAELTDSDGALHFPTAALLGIGSVAA